MFRLSVESAPFGRVGLKCGSEERREGQAPPLRGFKKAFRFCVGEPLGAPARIRTGSVGSAKSGAVVEPHRPQFSAQPGPGGPAGIQTLTQILRAGTFLPDPRGNPRKWGPGPTPPVRGRCRVATEGIGWATMSTKCSSGAVPGGVLVTLPPWAKSLAARRRRNLPARNETALSSPPHPSGLTASHLPPRGKA